MPSTRFTLAERFGPIVFLASNWTSRIGILLVTAAGVSWLFTLPANLTGSDHPYLGLLSVFLLPAVFLLGLALIPLGIWLRRRRGGVPQDLPPARWDNPHFRHLILFIGIATAANVVIGGHLTHSAIAHMDSVQFCGTSCHIMDPEFAAYQVSPHSHVACVDCHIGAGADSYIAAKVNGAKQLLQVLTNTYKTPVPTPVHNLAQGKLTCSKCHADRDFGVKRWDSVAFAPNQENTATRTQLAMIIGGGSNTSGAHGAHLGGKAKLEYRSTPDRKRIDWVRYTDSSGKVTTFARAGAAESGEARTMDCTDCHNRAAHSFEDPSRALNRSIAEGRIDRTLPFIKSEGLALLKRRDTIPEALRAFYQSKHPQIAASRGSAIETAARELTAIRDRNVFPKWGVDWGTHANLLSHEGCFRCHGGELVSQDGQRKTISRSCSVCHRIEKRNEPVGEALTSSSPDGEAGLPTQLSYFSGAGEVHFDHAKHLARAKGDCSSCHNRYFPMERAGLRYKANLHRTAEAQRTSCAGCHAPGGNAFASSGECARCHVGLSQPVRVAGATTTQPSALPGTMRFDTALGQVPFDHAQHVTLAKGTCSSCHNNLFPMTRADLNYRAGLHRPAEAARTSCGGCHAPAGGAFASAGNCQRCHLDLGTPRSTPRSGVSGLPESKSVETRLGAAKFDHNRHVTISKGDCLNCHTKIFPLAKGFLNYADNLHRTAEQNRTSCGACHRDGGTTFASKDRCAACHTELTARGAIPALNAALKYPTRLGTVAFDHNSHLRHIKGDCRRCHDTVFPMARRGLAGYEAGYHQTAEAKGELCAACHAPGGTAFATLHNCRKCHQGLEVQSAN